MDASKPPRLNEDSKVEKEEATSYGPNMHLEDSPTIHHLVFFGYFLIFSIGVKLVKSKS